MKIVRAVFLSLLSLLLVVILQNKLSEIPILKNYLPESLVAAPPIGSFLDPFNGFWQNAEPKNRPQKEKYDIRGLTKEVEILLDQRLVPHIFAENDHDAYLAQGYITAQHRLWQMEFLARLSAGRLSEVLGEKAIEIDKSQRRMGMLVAAEQSLANMRKDSTSAMILEAYTKGVNAYIQSLGAAEYPLEYKILDYKPEPWTPLKTALLLKYIAYDLSISGSQDLCNTQTAALYGEKTADSLYPNLPFREQPVIPTRSALGFKADKKIQKPSNYDSVSKVVAQNVADAQKILYKEQESKTKGSNNWVVAAQKSETGFPILANDPHLSLKLPSIWYELQIITPNMNVYGVSLPGAPTIVIGFNEKIAWGITSAYIDLLDFYQIRFKDTTMQEYWHDGLWKKTTLRKEIIKVKGKPDVQELIYATHHGNIVLDKPSKLEKGNPNAMYSVDVPYRHAMRWMGADSTSNEVKTFYKLNHSKNYADFMSAFEFFQCPALNFAYADVDKNIAMYTAGKIPMRWNGQGKYVLDGSSSAYEWSKFVPYQKNPQVLNPEQGFLASANQFIADTLTYPYYLNNDFVSPERAIRINEKLTAMSRVRYENMRELQNDVFGVAAREALPIMLKALDSTQLRGNHLKIYQSLKKWNYLYQSDAKGASFFDAWWREFRRDIWQDDLGSTGNFPDIDRTLKVLLQDSTSHWIDDIRTPQKEKLHDIINASFAKAVVVLEEKAKGDEEKWQWGKYKVFSLEHLVLPNMGISNLMTSGSSSTVNATGSEHGPSWRMIVMLGANTPTAYGTYPGGQSGNPGSFYYSNMVENWRLGELSQLLFLKNKNKSPKIMGSIRLVPKSDNPLE